MDLAHHIDEYSVNLLDRYMCTENICPCLDYKSEDGKSTKDTLFNTIKYDNRYKDINRTI